MKIEVKYKQEYKPVEEVIISFTPEECSYLLEVCRNIGGHPEKSPRKLFNEILKELYKNNIQSSKLLSPTSVLSFNDIGF